ncbi:hypothetical protein MK516_04400 [Streptococcus gallolyticus subsp. gallolyticus]|uniref:hypothetical protein n=1 Tax=Streptococcus gallolyticus TaxID=315405 RepID=UPI002284ED1F|nr:hypothetical protein [Streptococcus gallolyticus]MCY7171762.1 hypothetical protein [Streptococcus gallolyticus subsp. gallolyticus]
MKAERYMFLSMLLSFTIIVTVVFFTIELGMQKTVYNNKITELKLENIKQKYEIKRLEDNQTIVYHADNYGGEYDYERTVHANKQ